jgi:hypothetical protein
MRFMCFYTILGAGGFGLAIVITPGRIGETLGWPGGDPIALGVMGSVYVAFGVLSVLGLRDPLKFAPVLLLQLCYKSVWFAGVVLPLAVRGRFPDYGLLTAAIFATYIIGDLTAIPFPYLFARARDSQQAT